MIKLTHVTVTLSEGPQTVHLPAPGRPCFIGEHPTEWLTTLLYAMDTEQPSTPCLIYLSRARPRDLDGFLYVDVRKIHGQSWWLFMAAPGSPDRVLH